MRRRDELPDEKHERDRWLRDEYIDRELADWQESARRRVPLLSNDKRRKNQGSK
jgi:hypothetical protein